MLYYKDFATGKLKRTFGRPTRVERGGPLWVEGLIVENRASILFIPAYCLVGASQTWFHELKRKQEEGHHEPH